MKQIILQNSILPSKGFLVHGGSDNCNKGPLRCACVDLASGNVVFDVTDSVKHPKEMRYGSATEATYIAIFSAMIICKKHGLPAVIWTTIGHLPERVMSYKVGNSPANASPSDLHPLIIQAAKAYEQLGGDYHDLDIRHWDKGLYGESPLRLGFS